MKKYGRNDSCPCGSGKKFKKCCESKMIGGRFMATKGAPTGPATFSKMAGLFQNRVTSVPAPSSEHKPIRISALKNHSSAEAQSPDPKTDEERKAGE